MKIVMLCLQLALFAGLLCAQDSAKLLLTDVESEIDYSDAPFAQFNIASCEAINWNYTAEWGDGKVTASSKEETGSHYNDKSYRLRNLGVSTVWFSHVYVTANVKAGYVVKLIARGQCAGTTNGSFTNQSAQSIKVWGRVPVKSITVSPSTAKRGTSVHIEIQLEGTAPPSDTRVYIKSSPALFAALPPYVFVPKGTTKVDSQFAILGTCRPGRYVVSAWTSNDQKDQPPTGRFTVR